jgi:DNA-binding response OmpR family regulator
VGDAATRVLLVDDESASRIAVGAFLRLSGFDTREAVDGPTALDLLGREPADIVVTDVRMPGMDGLELLARIRRANPETCVVLLTGYGSEDTAVRAMRNGASNYFKKPVNFAEFGYALDTLAGLVRSRRGAQLDPALVERETRTLRLGPDVETVFPVIRDLTGRAAAFDFDVEAVRIGLLEMLMNAIEHGCLDIGGSEKREAVRRGTLPGIRRDRALAPPWRDRRVRVDYELTPELVSYRIADGGEGFDWRPLVAGDHPEDLLAGSGRGITVARLSMDELAYNDRGNEVLISKRRRR